MMSYLLSRDRYLNRDIAFCDLPNLSGLYDSHINGHRVEMALRMGTRRELLFGSSEHPEEYQYKNHRQGSKLKHFIKRTIKC